MYRMISSYTRNPVSLLFVATLLAALLLQGCVQRETIAPPSASPTSPPVAPPSKAQWHVEWEKVTSQAKREGKLVVAAIIPSDARKSIADAFKKTHGIEIEYITGIGSELVPKILQERKTGLYLEDAFIDGAGPMVNSLKPEGALQRLEPLLILPEVLDSRVWRDNSPLWIDKDHAIVGMTCDVQTMVFFNTDLVKQEEISYNRDLLQPKWKGKIIMADPTIPGASLAWFSVEGLLIMGQEWVRDLVKQEPLINRDERLVTEWVVRGKYPIGIGVKPAIVEEFRKLGAPVAFRVAKEGGWTSTASDNVGIIERAAHPEAAKVFMNWLLTKEGQTIYSKAVGSVSTRLDVTTEHIVPIRVPETGKKYFLRDREEYVVESAKYMALAKEIFAPVLK